MDIGVSVEMSRVRRNNARKLFLPLDIILGAIIGIYGFMLSGYNVSLEHASFVITLLSIALIAIDYFQLKYIGVKLISVVGAFILACHLFSFGEFYVCFFGHRELLVYQNWFSSDLDIKFRTGFYMLAALQCSFIGIFSYFLYSKHNRPRQGPKQDLTSVQWIKIGIVFLVLGLPCRVYWDYLNILQGRLSNIYAGGASVSGLIDDLQILFIPGVVCVLHGLRRNRITVITVVAIIIAVEFLVMASSGNRRLYITSLMGLVFYCYYEYPWKKRQWWKVAIFAVLGLVVLNYLELIRKHTFGGYPAGYSCANGVHYVKLSGTAFRSDTDFKWWDTTDMDMPCWNYGTFSAVSNGGDIRLSVDGKSYDKVEYLGYKPEYIDAYYGYYYCADGRILSLSQDGE